jgi:protein-S-isoprenylcysteine O-methyltransferase Ste14
LILVVSGIGLASGNWLGLIACVSVPLLGLLRRIQVEEAELNRVLGDPYRAYQTQTKRLIPGVW